VLQAEQDRAFMLQPSFKRGIQKLRQYGFTYDILIYPDQLVFTEKFVATFPDQLFVVDHIAKPPIKEKDIEDWKKNIKALASHPNVYCKISGMVTEADWSSWKMEDFTPYLDVAFDAFGTRRVLFGSDWPVCLVAGGYNEMIHMITSYISKLSSEEQKLFWGANAVKFYNIVM
jgi:L-fuconolactonase